MYDNITWPLFWGKSTPYKSLISHMIDTGNVSAILLGEGSLLNTGIFLSEQLGVTHKETINMVSYLAALHDIGKCHPCFQSANKETEIYAFLNDNKLLMQLCEMNTGFRHERYSAKVFQRACSEFITSKNTIKIISKILSMHHQGKNGRSFEVAENIIPWWFESQSQIEKIIRSIFQPVMFDMNHCYHVDAVSMTILGIVILADWIASGHWFENIEQYDSVDQYLEMSKRRALEAIQSIGMMTYQSLPAGSKFSSVWREINEDKLRPIQSGVQAICNAETTKLMIIEAPMGEGKTEAGIYAAACMGARSGKNGMYIALPTAATSNQMYHRFSELLLAHGIKEARLLHSMAWIFDEQVHHIDSEDTDEAERWFAPLRRGILANFAVGTVDQAMFAALKVKYGVLRLLGLTNKVLIIDEIHAYDAYMSQIIIRLLQWCSALKVPVVMLSATLPSAKRKQLVEAYGGKGVASDAYPLITTVDGSDQVKEYGIKDAYIKKKIKIDITCSLNEWDIVARLAVKMVAGGGCLCAIVNTVSDAQKLYQAIEQLCGNDIQLLLFHARFTAQERNRIENQCINLFGKSGDRPDKAILVATQVVEQSLDIDFDGMISAIAPVDLLLQRAGRIHRHEGRKRPHALSTPRLTVLIPADSKSYEQTKTIYPDLLLDRTVKAMRDRELIRIPEDIRPLVENVYDMSSVEQEEIEKWASLQFDETLKKGAAREYELPEPDEKSFCFIESGNAIFDDMENSDSYLSAKTRLGEPTTRVAFLPEDEAITLTEESMRSKSTARRVMSYSLSLRNKQLRVVPGAGFEPPMEGTGLLKGVWIYRLKGDRYDVKDDRIAGYRTDSKLGLMIERK